MRPLNLLLVSDDQAWQAAASLAVHAPGAGRLDIAPHPAEALRKLLAANGGYTHVLLDTAHGTAWLDQFIALTSGETLSGTALVRLGVNQTPPSGAPASGTPFVPYPLATLLAGTLATPPPAAAQPPLSTAEVVTALQDGHVQCRFQPIVRMADRRPVGLEALARLNHPLRGTLAPGLFIPQLEQAGRSLHLTEAVFQCCLSVLDPAFLESADLFLSVNLPLDALLLPEALNRIEARRQASAMPATRLLIELTESRPVHDLPALAAALDRWRQVGYRLAIDDLGPDVLNQTSLVDMPFHTVKLDKRIVARTRTDALACRYLQRTVARARSQAITIIAEGIEDAATWDQMAEMGVDQAQGFLIARALTAAMLPLWLEVWAAKQPF